MFWSDTSSDRIYRAWINGTGVTQLINSGLSNTCMMSYSVLILLSNIIINFVADGLAWDWINEKLYWADVSTRRIEVYDPSSRYRKVLFNTGSNTEPADIVVDPNNGYYSLCCH